MQRGPTAPGQSIRAVVVDQHPPSLIILTDEEVYRISLRRVAGILDLGQATERVGEWRARLHSRLPSLARGPTPPTRFTDQAAPF